MGGGNGNKLEEIGREAVHDTTIIQMKKVPKDFS